MFTVNSKETKETFAVAGGGGGGGGGGRGEETRSGTEKRCSHNLQSGHHE